MLDTDYPYYPNHAAKPVAEPQRDQTHDKWRFIAALFQKVRNALKCVKMAL